MNRMVCIVRRIPIQIWLAAAGTAWILYQLNYYLDRGLVTGYGDAPAKLNLAASVFFNQLERFSLPQLGGLWTWLQIIPMLPFVWWKPMYESGLAGAIPSMIWFIVMVVVVYEITFTFFKSKLAGLTAYIAVIMNVNVLYLAVTPLSESLTMMALSLVSLLFMRLENAPRSMKFLVILSCTLPFTTQIRYEFWFLTGFVIVVMFVLGWAIRGVTGYELIARLVCVMMLSAFAMALWLWIEWLIYGDPLYFSHSEYSAHFIDIVDGGRTQAIGNVRESLRLYLTIVKWNLPREVFICAVAGFGIYLGRLVMRTEKHMGILYMVGLVGFFPLALFLGQFVVDLSTAYNVRHGTTILPLVGICVGYLAGYIQLVATKPVVKHGLITFVILTVVTSNGIWLANPLDKAIVLRLTQGSDPGLRELISCVQSTHIATDDGIVLARLVGDMNTVQFRSRIPLQKLVTERYPAKFEEVRLAPSDKISWVITRKGDIIDQEIQEYPKRYEPFEVVCQTEWGTLLHWVGR